MTQPSPARAETKKHVILFLAANPLGTSRIALDREARSIHLELKRSGHRNRFDFVTRWAAEPLDLLREIRELKPAVVHFSGHGGGHTFAAGSTPSREVAVAVTSSGEDSHGLCFQAVSGQAQFVSTEAIAQTLEAAGPSVRLVVLNACFTESLADAVLAHIDCVVGIRGAIHDDAARTFATGFYGGLGEHESVAVAFKQGRAAINLEGMPDADRPQLKVRDGFDASQLILAAMAVPISKDVPCPYPGMRPYTADDAAVFHGRDVEIEEIIGRLRAGEREIYVIGPSGSGKSSLVAAGVLPRIARGISGLGPFVVRTLRPGEHPAARLHEVLELSPGQPFVASERIAALLAHRVPESSVLLLVDQLEELFALAGIGERTLFLHSLAAIRSEPRFLLIFTLRADFFGAFMESTLWSDHDGRISRIEVAPLRGRLLSEAITAPASDLGIDVEPELIGQLLADVGSASGVLPLLQETLVQLWDRRQGPSLTLADYQALGDGDRNGLAVALSRRADAILRTLTRKQETIARRILLRLVSFGEGCLDTRRQQMRAELRIEDDRSLDFDSVLGKLIAGRLLTADDENSGADARIDLAHEALIGAWTTFADWIHTFRAEEQYRRQLEAAARRWVADGRGARGLLAPREVAEAEVWGRTQAARDLGSSAEAHALIAMSRRARKKQLRRRRYVALSALTTLTVALMAVFRLTAVARQHTQRLYQEAEQALTQAKAHLGTGQLIEALPLLQDCVAKARAASASEVEGRCHLAAASALTQVGYVNEAKKELLEAESLLSKESDLAMLWFERGNLTGGLDGKPGENVAAFERALELAKRAQAMRLSLLIELALIKAHTDNGNIERAKFHHAIAIGLDHERNYEHRLALLAAQISYQQGDLEGARLSSLRLYEQMSDFDDRTEICVMQARIALRLGDLNAAETWARRGIEAIEGIRSAQTAIELHPWVLASRRPAYELLFVALVRANRLENAVNVFDRLQGHGLLDLISQPDRITSHGLSGTATEIQTIARLLLAVSKTPLMSTDDRAVIVALRSLDALALLIADGDIWRVVVRHGRIEIDRVGSYASLKDLLERFTQNPTESTNAETVGNLLIPVGIFHDTSTVHIILDRQLGSLPVVALRHGGKPLIAARPVLRLLRLPTVAIDTTCDATPRSDGATILADGSAGLPAEAQEIGRYLNGSVFVGDMATSKALFGARSNAVLHLSVPFNFDSDGEVFKFHDRSVSALEIAAEKLGPRLVVLSACESARSSFPSVFLANGSSWVIGTLSPVPVRSEAIRLFYKADGPSDPVHILAAVQAGLARTDDPDWWRFEIFGLEACPRREEQIIPRW